MARIEREELAARELEQRGMAAAELEQLSYGDSFWGQHIEADAQVNQPQLAAKRESETLCLTPSPPFYLLPSTAPQAERARHLRHDKLDHAVKMVKDVEHAIRVASELREQEQLLKVLKTTHLCLAQPG